MTTQPNSSNYASACTCISGIMASGNIVSKSCPIHGTQAKATMMVANSSSGAGELTRQILNKIAAFREKTGVYDDWSLANDIEAIIIASNREMLEGLLGKLPDGDKMPAILMGGRDYAYESYATSAYKYAIEQVKAIIEATLKGAYGDSEEPS